MQLMYSRLRMRLTWQENRIFG